MASFDEFFKRPRLKGGYPRSMCSWSPPLPKTAMPSGRPTTAPQRFQVTPELATLPWIATRQCMCIAKTPTRWQRAVVTVQPSEPFAGQSVRQRVCLQEISDGDFSTASMIA